MKIVSKFGGSSLANAEQFHKVKAIINADKDRQLVVVSAAGKGTAQPVKLTDQLIQIYQRYHNNEDYLSLSSRVERRCQLLADQLGINVSIKATFDQIIDQLPQLSYPELVSRGEFMTAKLMAAYLDWPMLDAKDFLVLIDGQVDLIESKRRLDQLLGNYQHVVIPGFYGVNQNNEIALLPRGGGDTSGAIVANLVNADRYENWTDTNGVLVSDPGIVANPQPINVMSYDELQELSNLGMKVFQEVATYPVRIKKIPVVIKNTNDPKVKGTWVVANKRADLQAFITGITGKRQQTLLIVHKYQLINDPAPVFEAIRKLSDIGNKFSYVFDGTDRLTVTLDDWNKVSDRKRAVQILKRLLTPERLAVEDNLSLVSLVSDRLERDPMMIGDIINHLNAHHVNVQTVFQANSDNKMILGVAADDYEKTIQFLYELSVRNKMKRRSLIALNH